MVGFFNEQTDFLPNQQKKLKTWIRKVIEEHGQSCGEINLIFTNDSYLLEINKEFLQHDYFTDVITFSYSDSDLISGDIFISIDRVEENAKIYSESFEDELYRVIIHGVLHMLGYNDSTDIEKLQMRQKEDYCLNLLKTIESED